MKPALASDFVLARYRITDLLGAGGMGEVYKAWDSSLERSVALKVLPPQLVQNSDRVRRFVQEAKAASSLNHPHIITIHDAGTESGVHFIAMELIEGETLRTKISGGASLRDLIGWLAQAADGLAKAHAAGIVHRDLKPDNIMITRDGYAKVLDFGLAKLIEPSSPPTAAHEVTQVRDDAETREGFVVGTIGYMSPEQVQGQPVDHRADIFSFGSILYEAATRRRAFAADSDVDLMHKIVHDQPEPVDRINPSTPAELRRVIRRCLAKDPDQRIQSMKDLAIELHEIHDEFESLTTHSDSHSMPTVIVPVAALRRRSWRVMAIAVAALIVIVIGIAIWQVPHGPQFTLDKLQIRKLTTNGNVRKAAISPDGKYLAYDVNSEGKFSIRLRQVATGSDLQTTLPDEQSIEGISFTPDSNYLYFSARETAMSEYSILQSIPTLGGNPRKLVFDVDTDVTFSPDGSRIAFVRGAPDRGEMHLVVAGADGSNPRVLYASRGGERLDTFAPSWSPDGKRIAATTGFASDIKSIVIVDAATGAVSKLGEPWSDLTSVVWLPDGSGVIASATPKGGANGQVWFVGYPEGKRSRIFSDLNDYSDLTMTADGRSLAAVQLTAQSSIHVTGPNGDRLLSGPEASRISGFAAAGDRIVYSLFRPGASQLWVVDANGTRTQLTGMTPADWPSSSRDGRTVLFSGRVDGVPHVFAIDIDGNNLRQVTRGDGELYPDIAPDGTWFVYTTKKDGRIMRQSIGGGTPQLVEANNVYYAKIAPDGKSVALAAWRRDANGKAEINLTDVPVGGGTSRGSIPWLAERNWEWTPSGEIAWVSPTDRRSLWSTSFAGGPPRKLLELPSSAIATFAFSADAKTIYTAHTDASQDAVLLTDFR